MSFDYQLVKTQRRSISIRVKNEGVVVGAPIGVSNREIKQWLETKAVWVHSQLEKWQAHHQEIPVRYYQSGEVWSYLGEGLQLVIQVGQRKSCQRVGDKLVVNYRESSRTDRQEQTKTAIESWYKDQARLVIPPKVIQYCAQLGVSYSAINYRKTRSKWGHCTRSGNLQFNWLIMQAPESVIDYLVAHECCHLVHLNHSRAFWTLVEKVYPNYVTAKQWLKDNGHKLVV